MQVFSRLLIPVLVCSMALTATAAEKYALLIGVTKYEHAQMNRTPLKYPEADATAVAELLEGNGYEVKALTGKAATRDAVEAELLLLEKRGSEDGVVFIGLFGHGVQYGNDAYFAPYNTQVRKVTDSAGKTVFDGKKPKLEPDPASMISMQRLLEALTTCGASNRVIIADCCREDPSVARGRAFGSNVKISDLEPGTAAIFSCSNTEQAYEHDDWGHGAFTKSLLDYCSTLKHGADATANTMSVPLFRTVRSMVTEKTKGRATQTVNPIVNGVVDLRLDGPSEDMIPAGNIRNDNSLKMDLVWCPAGELTFEQVSGQFSLRFNGSSLPYGEKPFIHSSPVTLTSGFWIGRYEVTVSQLRDVLNEESNQALASIESDKNSASTSWLLASKFCEELTTRERNAGRISPTQLYRLPTMAQWQYAFRAGSQDMYFFGQDLSAVGQFATGLTADNPGLTRPNPWGIFDMMGHLPEWCDDWFSDRFWPEGNDPAIAEKYAFIRERDNTPIQFKVLAGPYYGAPEEAEDTVRNPDQHARGAVFEGGTLDCPYYGIRIVLIEEK